MSSSRTKAARQKEQIACDKTSTKNVIKTISGARNLAEKMTSENSQPSPEDR